LAASLVFPPLLMSYEGVSLGTSASGAVLLLNTNQVANGLLGFATVLPVGATFAPGTQEVARVTFRAAVVLDGVSNSLAFGDVPTKRELADPRANLLPVMFGGGSITMTAARFEGDVSPRPNGDEQVTVVDWVLLGLYAAGLDYPADGSQFQQADCAPRDTSG